MTTEEEKKEIVKKVSFNFLKLREFLDNNKAFIDDGPAETLFALGVLIRLVFNMQQASLHSTPFEKKLKGMQLSSRDVNRLFTEAVEKVNQYAYSYTYKDLRSFVAENLLEYGKQISQMPNQELSFNIVAGLELGSNFKSEKK